MKLSELDFTYPEELVATVPVAASRVMKVGLGRSEEQVHPEEINKEQLLELFQVGDVLVVNNSQVVKRRVFLESGIEVLFLKKQDEKLWSVLMPVRRLKGKTFELPNGVTAELVSRDRPQVIRVDQELSDEYFEKYAELPLPPYIQKARGERKPVEEDKDWYQTDWSKEPGSLAAPTASFHFQNQDLEALKEKGVKVCDVTLHVGLGTFLPIMSEDLSEHQMHEEFVSVSCETWKAVQNCRKSDGKVWALGSTVTRSLESVAQGLFAESSDGSYTGETRLFLKPGDEFQVVDCLLTNFHQPKTTLIAMVMAFAGKENVRKCYEWAIERKFRLFSYGDLSLWTK